MVISYSPAAFKTSVSTEYLSSSFVLLVTGIIYVIGYLATALIVKCPSDNGSSPFPIN